MMDFKLGEIVSLLARTAPFLVFRFVIYFGITLAYMLATGAGAGVGYGVASAFGEGVGGGIWGGLIGLGAAGTVVYLLREYLLYLVKAGHIAVLVELMEGKALPVGRGQIDYAQRIVRERFAESSVLFGLDQLIKGVLRAFNRVFFTLSGLIPIPAVQGIVRLINTVVNLSLTYLDEVILAYNIRMQSVNPWQSGQTALVLYAQNYKAFLKNAFWLASFIWGLTLLVFLIILAPVTGLVALFPGTTGGVAFIVALVFAWGVKQAVIEPFGMAALMQVFFKVTEGQQPNPEWEARLDKVSGKFRQLKDKGPPGASPRTVPRRFRSASAETHGTVVSTAGGLRYMFYRPRIGGVPLFDPT